MRGMFGINVNVSGYYEPSQGVGRDGWWLRFTRIALGLGLGPRFRAF